MALKNSVARIDVRHPGVNNSELQEGPMVLDIYESMADDDTAQVVVQAAAGNPGLPPRSVVVLRHTGGDITSAAAATRAMSSGNTADIFIDHDNNGKYEQVTHIFTGLTAAAATPAEIAASLNADARLTPYLRAVAGLTANAVTLFPILPRSKIYVGAQPATLGFAGTADYSARTYVVQTQHILTGTTGFSWDYVAATRLFTLKNETGGAVNRVTAIISM
jgi:hypothetical protein